MMGSDATGCGIKSRYRLYFQRFKRPSGQDKKVPMLKVAGSNDGIVFQTFYLGQSVNQTREGLKKAMANHFSIMPRKTMTSLSKQIDNGVN